MPALFASVGTAPCLVVIEFYFAKDKMRRKSLARCELPMVPISNSSQPETAILDEYATSFTI